MKRAARVLLVIATACGARTDLGGGHVEAGSSATCSAPLPKPAACTTWSAGTPQTIGTGTLGDATASGCGVLVAWSTLGADSVAWTTRWVDFDGAVLAPPVAHPSLTAQTNANAAISLAEGGMLEDDTTGCHFVTVDTSGHEQDFTSLGAPGCTSLARAGARWSFLRRSENGGGSLVTFGNGPQVETPLAFADAQAVWDRVVLADGSFIASGFWEDAQTAVYTDWLTPFDANGAPLGASVVVPGFDQAPVLLARGGDHVMAAWQWTNVTALPVSTLGAPLAPSQSVTTDAPIYELSLFTQPNGDVLVAWIVLDEKTDDMSLHARVIAPDGTPRAAETLLASGLESAQVRGAIESNGARALLVVSTKDGTIEALPLECQ